MLAGAWRMRSGAVGTVTPASMKVSIPGAVVHRLANRAGFTAAVKGPWWAFGRALPAGGNEPDRDRAVGDGHVPTRLASRARKRGGSRVRTHVGIRRLLIVGATLIAAAALATAPVAGASGGAASRGAGSAHTVQHDLKHVPAGKPKDAVFGCQLPGGPTDIFCYSPQQMRTAYGVDKLIAKGFDGRGRTIVIIDAFQSPTMVDDLAAFDAAFGLPDPVFRQVAPQGLTPFDPTDPNMVGWSGEIALDVEWS